MRPIPKWTDCGFKNETPPDLHGTNTGHFNVYGNPYEGVSFLGMVVRFNDTWERVSQKLSSPLRAGKCYKFSIYLSRNLYYKSATKESRDVEQSFAKPCVLRLFGGNGYCSTKEMLGESIPVSNTDWRRYDFILKPKQDWEYFELQAFFKTPVLFPYNGNLLLDAASDIVEIPCPKTPILAAEPQEPTPEEEARLQVNQDPRGDLADQRTAAPDPEPEKPVESKPKEDSPKSQEDIADNTPTAPKKPKILKELDAEKIEEGQVIQIEKLYFDADKTFIKAESHEVLDEVFDFLESNPQVTVEIGGHTNSKPKDSYCDRLSKERAESVADYLINKGIDSERIQSKGYGKRRPIAKGNTPYAHQRNQRVEIKILSVNG